MLLIEVSFCFANFWQQNIELLSERLTGFRDFLELSHKHFAILTFPTSYISRILNVIIIEFFQR